MVHKQKIAITTADYRRTERIMAHFYNDGFAYTTNEALANYVKEYGGVEHTWTVPCIINWSLQTGYRTIRYFLPEAKTIHCDMETGLSVAVWADGTKTFVKPMIDDCVSTDRRVFAIDAMRELFKKKLYGNHYAARGKCDYMSISIIDTLSCFCIQLPFMHKEFDEWGVDSGLAMVNVKTDIFNETVRKECHDLLKTRKNNVAL